MPERSVPYSSAMLDCWSGVYSVPGACAIVPQPEVHGRALPAVVVRLSGDVDAGLDPKLRHVLSTAVAQRLDRVTVDLADVTFLDCTVLRTLVATRRRCAAAGTRFILRRPCPAVERLLAVTRLDRIFEIEGGLPAAA